MKFSDLSILSQIAIAANMSSLFVDTTTSSFTHSRPPEAKIKPTKNTILIKAAGIEASPDTLINISSVIVSNVEMKKSHNAFNFGHNTVKNSVRFNKHINGVELYLNVPVELRDTGVVVFDRFGLMGNITITENLGESVSRIIKLLAPFVALAPGAQCVLDVLTELEKGIVLAEALPDEVIDAIKGSKSLSSTFNELVKMVSYSDYDYDEDSGNRINLPPIICESIYSAGISTYYTYGNLGANHNRLLVEFRFNTETEEYEIVVSVNFNAKKSIQLGAAAVVDNLSDTAFIEKVIEVATNSVNASEHKDALSAQLTHFTDTVKAAIPFVLDELNKK